MQVSLERILPTVQKPGRYTGGEYNQIKKDLNTVRTRIAFCFPDTYEIGMSNLGMRILYGVMNEMDGVWCERVFAPWADMQSPMEANHIPLWALESQDSVADFDMIAFTIGYEMSYSNILNMLRLSGVPLHSKDRQGLKDIVFAGGVCAFNPEPLADYIDAVRIMNPIQTADKGVGLLKWPKGRDLAYYTYLRKCRYQVQAHFEWNENRPEYAADRDADKHFAIAKRSIEKGGRRDVFLGARECQPSSKRPA